jgi:chorismate mutase/prephenate dehydrogenase
MAPIPPDDPPPTAGAAEHAAPSGDAWRDQLGALRDEIDALDRRLIATLAERRDLVARVAELKRDHGLPVYHPAREEDLISARRHDAERAALDPDLIEDVFRRVVRASRVQQTSTMGRHAVRPGATVLIVGGAGEMGRLFARWFATAGYQVRVLDRDDWGRAGALAQGADLALLAVPIDRTPEVALRLGPHLPAECVLADITSTKSEPVAAMLAAHAGPVVGLHPMFGPTTTSLDKQIVVVTPGRDGRDSGASSDWIVEQFAAWGAVVVRATPAEHDDAMAIVQALRHFATFAFGRFLASRRIDLHRSLDFSSPIYRLELAMVGRLFAQDPGLYAEIIFATPDRRELLREYAASLAEAGRLVEGEDRGKFMAEFREIAQWFGPFGEQAIRESTYLIEKLVERF